MSIAPASPSERTSSGPNGPRPWRLAVIGTVAVLAVAIGLAAGFFLTTTRATVVGAGADYVPATATFYVELQLEPSAEQDAALRDLLGRFPPIDGVDLDRPLADQLAELLDEALADDELDLSWTEDVAPWTDGRVAVALIELPAEAFDPMADPTVAADAPPTLLLLGVTDADVARASVERILAEAGAPAATTTEHRGVTIHAAGEEGAYAITDDQLIAAPSADDIVAALDAREAGTTLAARDEIASLVESLPDDWLAFGVFDFTEAMTAALEVAGTESPASSAAMAQILEHQSLRAAFTARATDAGLAIDTAGAPPTGSFAVENEDRGLASSIPGDALYFAEGGNIGPALVEIIGAVKEAASAEPEAAEAVATAEAALGADLEELVAWVDDGALAAGWDGTEVYGGVVLVPSDVAAAERRLDQLATFARLAAIDPTTGVSVVDEEIEGAAVTTIAWEDPEMGGGMVMGMPTGISLQYALTDDDRVLVGVGERFVGLVLGLDAADSLAAQPRFADAVAELGGSEHAGVGWMDLAGIVEAAETALGPMIGTADDDAILAWLRPLDRTVSVGRLEGDALVQRSVLFLR